jgi:surface protein
MRKTMTILFLFVAFFLSNSTVQSQCTTGLVSPPAGDTDNIALVFGQSFQVSCTGKLNSIVFTPVGEFIDDLRSSSTNFVSVRIKNSSGTVLAVASIGGSNSTRQWFDGATITADFSAADLTLNANTQYIWEAYQTSGDFQLILFSNTSSDSYTLGGAVDDGISLPNSQDWVGWTVNVTAAPNPPSPDNFITTWTNTDGTFSQLQFNAVTTGPVNYSYTTNLGKTGSGSFSSATINDGVTLALGNTIAQNEVLTLVMEPTNLRQVQLGRLAIANSNSRTYLTNVNQWGTTAWTAMDSAFFNCTNLNISATDVPNLANATSLQFMFSTCIALNGPANIGTWNVSTITNMSAMFNNTSAFNQNISGWDVSKVSNMNGMFQGAIAFNQNIGSWNTAAVTNMSSMFNGATAFNQAIGTWNTAAVTNMSNMFNGATAFNQNLGTWNTGKVTAMDAMFTGATAFNNGGSASIGNWNTAAVTFMNGMFQGATAFNQNISAWNTAAVSDMSSMFRNATSFNQDIGNWNTAAVTSMGSMFQGATAFNQNIGTWTLNANVNLGGFMSPMLSNCGMDCQNYSATLVGWAANPATPNGRMIRAAGRTYGTDAVAARNTLTSTKGWSIVSDAASGIACLPTPVLSAIPNQAVCDGEIIMDIPITLGVVTDATLSATDNSATINPTYTFGGSGAARTLTISTELGQVGPTVVTVTATSSLGSTASTTFTLEVGNKVIQPGEMTTYATGFNNPIDIDYNGNSGVLYVSERTQGKIVAIDPQGNKSDYATGLNTPEGISFNGGSTILYVAENQALRVSTVNSLGQREDFRANLDGAPTRLGGAFPLYMALGNGTFTRILPTPNLQIAGNIFAVDDIALAANGDALVTRGGSSSINRITSSGDVSIFNNTIQYPTGIARCPVSGKIYVTSDFEQEIKQFDPDGSNMITYRTGIAPTAMTCDIQGNLYGIVRVFSSQNANYIVKIAPSTVSFVSCNTAPVIAPIATQSICDNEALELSLTFTDDEMDPVSITATSSNTTLVPNSNISYDATSGILTVTPAMNQVGETTISLVPNDGKVNGDTIRFVLEVGNKVVGAVITNAIATFVDNPIDIVADNENNLYVAIANEAKVVKIAVGTNAVSDFVTGINFPRGLAFDTDQNLYITTVQGKLFTRNKVSGLVSEITPSSSIGFSNIGLAYQAPTTLYTGSTNTIFKLNTNGTSVTTVEADLANPFGFTVFGNDLYAAYGNSVYKYTNGVAPATQYTSTFIAISRGMVFDAVGNLYVAGFNGIFTIPPGGGVAQQIISQEGNKNGMTINSLGEVFYTDITTGKVFRINQATITYEPCNAKPVFTAVSPGAFANDTVCIAPAGGMNLPVRNLTVSDPDGSIVSTVVSSSNPALIEAIKNSPSNTDFGLLMFQFPNQSGTATIKIVSTDNLGAKDSISFVIQVNSVSAGFSQTNVNCFGESTGSMSVTPTGGTAPYSYSWTQGGSPLSETTASITNKPAGSYSVVIQDQFMCQAVVNFTLQQPAAALTLSTTKTDIVCAGDMTGVATVIPAGGTPGYSYAWSHNQAATSASVNGLGEGSYMVTVTDVNGCSATASIQIDQVDTVAPVQDCKESYPLTLIDAQPATISLGDLLNAASTDNCGILTETANNDLAFNCTEPTSQLVTITTTDVNGNSSVCSVTVNVEGCNRIEIRGNNVAIPNGMTTTNTADNTDFGIVVTNGNKQLTFQAVNISNTFAVNLTGNPRVTTDNPLFVVSTQPNASIPIGISRNFRIRFDATAIGVHEATVTILTDDPNNTSYTFKVSAEVLASEMEVRGNDRVIANNDMSPEFPDLTNFGNSVVGFGKTVWFYAHNEGAGQLNLPSTPKVRITGPGASHYSVTQDLPTNINSGVNRAFRIRFQPTSLGTHQATIEISNNDLETGGTYRFTIVGTGVSTVNGKQAKDEELGWMLRRGSR